MSEPEIKTLIAKSLANAKGIEAIMVCENLLTAIETPEEERISEIPNKEFTEQDMADHCWICF